MIIFQEHACKDSTISKKIVVPLLVCINTTIIAMYIIHLFGALYPFPLFCGNNYQLFCIFLPNPMGQ